MQKTSRDRPIKGETEHRKDQCAYYKMSIKKKTGCASGIVDFCIPYAVHIINDPPLSFFHSSFLSYGMDPFAMSTIQNALTAKLTSPSVPICPRREVTQVIYTAIVFAILIAVWSGLRLYARSLRQLSLNTEEALFSLPCVDSTAC